MVSKNAQMWRLVGGLFLLCALGAKHVTPNFEVEAPTAAMAEKVALTAERSREELAIEWLGHKLPNWSARCQVRVRVGQMGAGGATTFSFGNGHVFGWDMNVQGSLERILGSVIPHEVSHTVFASHFRRPLPRWADEGAATLAEEEGERRRQQKLAEEVMPTKRRIALRELLQITEYPKNMQHVLTLYAEGYSLADFLVQQGGKPRFLAFMQDAHQRGWDEAIHRHYDESNIESLEKKWNHWILAGSPSLERPDGTLLAKAGRRERSSHQPDASATPELLAQADRGERSSASTNRTSPVRESSTAREAVTATDSASVVRSQTPEGEKKSTNVADVTPAGHSIAPRGEVLSAPVPRRNGRSTPTTNDLTRVSPATQFPRPRIGGEGQGEGAERLSTLEDNPLTPTLSPEAGEREKSLRRAKVSNIGSTAVVAAAAEIASPVALASNEGSSAIEPRRAREAFLTRPELRQSPDQDAASVEPSASRSDGRSDLEMSPPSPFTPVVTAAPARAAQQGTTVHPANDRKSSLRFKPFPSP